MFVCEVKLLSFRESFQKLLLLQIQRDFSTTELSVNYHIGNGRRLHVSSEHGRWREHAILLAASKIRWVILSSSKNVSESY